MDEILELMEKTSKRIQKTVEQTKENIWKQAAIYEQLQQSPEATQDQKTKAFIKKTFELDRLEWQNSQLSLIYLLQIFAFKVKVLEVSVGKIHDEVSKSGVLQSGEELQDIKKNIDALKILMEAQYDSMKEINESQNKNLGYIH
ncbi:MAG: hypothetical protein NWE93_13410 [Candidatus Bathyarchaeota archaeon]|nr:hypothetical protein [Candidatus Bathyarchaeota archaeon]